MNNASEGGPTGAKATSPTTSMSQAELLWVVSRALLSAQETSNDVVAQAALIQYRQSSEQADSLDGQALDSVEHRLDQAVEDIEIAKDAVRELRSERSQ